MFVKDSFTLSNDGVQTAGSTVACKAEANFGSINSEGRKVLPKNGSLANTSRYDIQVMHLTDQPRSRYASTDSRQVPVAVERTNCEVVTQEEGDCIQTTRLHRVILRSSRMSFRHTYTCMYTHMHAHT